MAWLTVGITQEKHTLIISCRLRILKLDTILHLLRNTYGFNTLIDCLNLSLNKRLNLFQCTVINELNKLLLTRYGEYRMHNFTKSDIEKFTNLITTD